MFHINGDGEVKPCSASSRESCRFSDRPHFDREIDAWRAQDEIYSDISQAPTFRKKKVKVDDAYNTPITEIENGLVLDRDTGRTYSTDLKIAPISGVEELKFYLSNAREARNLARSEKSMDLVVNSDGDETTDELFSDEFIVIERRTGRVMSPNIVIVENPEHPLDRKDFLNDHDFAIEYSDNWGMPISIAR